MDNVYLFTAHLAPSPGGLELWTHDLALRLGRSGFRVVVCLCSPRESLAFGRFAEVDGVQVVPVVRRGDLWKEPLEEAPASTRAYGTSRLDYLDARRILAADAGRQPGRSIIVSNFLCGVGFLASLVAESLDWPHLPCVVGTDFNRGFYNGSERSIIREVVERASGVVTLNGEQKTALQRRFPSCPMRVIHTSVPPQVLKHTWRSRDLTIVRIISDGGYSSKKGTQVLLWACRQLMTEKIPIQLTIFGSADPREQNYWQRKRHTLFSEHPDAFFFHPWASRQKIWEQLAVSSIYCSPTIGEGCSQARIAALCIGIPIVTSCNAEMADLATDLPHVHLFPVGDEEAFLHLLRLQCQKSLAGRATADSPQWQSLRTYLADPARETAHWAEAITDTLSRDQSRANLPS